MAARRIEDDGRAAEVEGEKEREESKFVAQSFFKIFFPQKSGERLRIPPSFRKYLQNEPIGTVSLKGPSGNIWRVELASGSDGLSFVHGWKEFVRDHSIQAGHFLVFTNYGRSQYKVLVFDPSGTENMTVRTAQPHKELVVKIEDDEGDMDNAVVATENLAPPIEEHDRTTGKRTRELVDLMEVNTFPLSKKKDDPMENGSPLKKSSESDVLRNAKIKRARASVGGSKAAPASLNSTKAKTPEDSYDFASSLFLHIVDSSSSMSDEGLSCNKLASLPATMSKMMFRTSKDVPRRGKSLSRGQRLTTVISQRREVTEAEKELALQKAKEFKSKNPFVMQIMKESYVYVGFFLNIPCEFVREYLPRTNKKMTLWDPQGKSWEINYVYYSDRCVGSFSGGWGKFALANNLEKFDVCIFELIQKDNIKVHIYRVVAKISPYIFRSSQK